MQRLLLVILTLTLSIAPLPHARAQDPSRLQAILDAAVEAGTAGVVVWVDSPAGTYSAAAGVADAEGTIALTPTDAFRTGSITKLFVAVVTLQLMEEGVLRLDDTLGRWLPDVAANLPNGEIITLRQLLNHTAGLYEYTTHEALVTRITDDPARQWEPRELVAVIYDQTPAFVPGTSFSYSNTGYVLLGMVIEAATDQTLAQAIRTRILEPLAMTHTYLADAEAPTTPLVYGFSTDVADPSTINVSAVWAAGAMVSTAPDLITFIRAVFAGELYTDPATLATMLETVEVAPGAAYGMGLVHIENRWWGHDGGITGFTSLLLYDPKADTVVIMWANVDSAVGVNPAEVFAATGIE